MTKRQPTVAEEVDQFQQQQGLHLDAGRLLLLLLRLASISAKPSECSQAHLLTPIGERRV